MTDAVSVLALCLGFAFLPLAGDESGYRFRRPGWAALGNGALAGAPGNGALGNAKALAADDDAEEAPGDDEPSRDEEPSREEEGSDDQARGPAAPVLRPLPPAARNATLVLLALFLAGSFWSLQALEGITNNQAARSYIATARIAVAKAPRGALIIDGPTPAFIMDPYFFYLTGYTSQVIGAMARAYPAKHLTWTRSLHGGITRTVMVFDAQGRLRPAVLAGVASGPPPAPSPARSHGRSHGRSQRTSRQGPPSPGPRCWKLAATGTSIPLRTSLFRWSWTVRLDYSGPATVLTVRFGGNAAQADLPAGTHFFYVPLAAGSGRTVTVTQVSPGTSACLTGVTVGTWHPAPSGRPIPATPAAG